MFLPQEEGLRLQTRKLIEECVEHMGHDLITWRVVPTNNRTLGLSARATEPVIEQLFISAAGHLKLEVEQQVFGGREGSVCVCGGETAGGIGERECMRWWEQQAGKEGGREE